MPFATDNRSPLRRQLPGAVKGLGASQVAVIDLPVGQTYRALVLKLTIAGVAPTRAQIESMYTQLRLTVSGTELWSLTPTQLLAIIEFYQTGIVGDTGYLRIPFVRPWMRDNGLAFAVNQGPVMGPALGTVGESSCQLEITQDATNTIDAVEVWAEIDPLAQPLGAHIRYVRNTQNLGLGLSSLPGALPRPSFAQGVAQYLYAIHIQVPTAADLTVMTYSADGIRLFDQMTQALLARQYAGAIPTRTLQTAKKVISLDFASSGFDFDAVPLSMLNQLLELTFANTAPGNVGIIAEIGTNEPTNAGLIAGR